MGDIHLYKKKYGAKGVDNVQRLMPFDSPQLIEWRDELDQHYTKLWLDYTYGGLFARQVIDDRTRLLVVVGQCVVLDELEQLEVHVRSALVNGVASREVLEVILQATVYAGYPKVVKAARVFTRVITDLGRLDEITSTQLPLEGRGGRTLEQDRPTWRVPDEKFPRRQEMMDKYGWQGIGTGIRLQPTHHVRRVEMLDRYDPHFLKLWEDFIYAGMYERRVLDDKTRVLCMVGECAAIDEMIQAENHMKAALMLGATPREVVEVLFQTTAYAGMPRPLKALDIFERILNEQGRISELTETATPIPG